jgi:hypothetical protein
MVRQKWARSSIAEIFGQVCEHHALSDIRDAQTMWVERSSLIIMST